jgi:hypothetical protein
MLKLFLMDEESAGDAPDLRHALPNQSPARSAGGIRLKEVHTAHAGLPQHVVPLL